MLVLRSSLEACASSASHAKDDQSARGDAGGMSVDAVMVVALDDQEVALGEVGDGLRRWPAEDGMRVVCVVDEDWAASGAWPMLPLPLNASSRLRMASCSVHGCTSGRP